MKKLVKCFFNILLFLLALTAYSCSNWLLNDDRNCTVRIDVPAELSKTLSGAEEYNFNFELKGPNATFTETAHLGDTVYFYLVPGDYSFKCSVTTSSSSKVLYSGTKNVTVVSGTENEIDFELTKVKDNPDDPAGSDPEPARSSDYSTAKVGDIILSDGTILKKDDTYDSDTMTAVAIIVREQGEKPAMGMGIKNAKAEFDNGTSTNPASTTVCWYGNTYSGFTNSANITSLDGNIDTGYVDGEDCYDKLLAVSGVDANTIKNYYHAIYGARDYANTYSLTGDFATGWYLPTVDEWNTATENIDEIRSSLEKVGGTGIEKASNNVNINYWTCNTTSTNYATQFTPATKTPTDNAGRTGSAYIRAFRLFRN